MQEMQLIEMNPPDSRLWNFDIPFVWQSKDYGRAEFDFCFKFKRAKITELWISPRQQKDEQGKLYHINVHGSDSILNSGEGRLWYMGWCKMHKAAYSRIYVPDNTSRLHISLLSSLSISFH